MEKVELTRTAKYYCNDLEAIRERLRRMQAAFVITKQQTDYIYRIYDEHTGTKSKRVKIRIEDERSCCLYVYDRTDQERDIAFEYYASVDRQLIPIFNAIYGDAVRIRKAREVWRLGELEYHLDTVDEIGTIFEIENLRPAQPNDDGLACFQDVLLTKIEGSNEDLIGGERDSGTETK
jgi:adenylate cyclase class IV